MPLPSSVTSSAVATLGNISAVLDGASRGQVDQGSLQQLLGGGQGSLDASALTSQLAGLSGSSGGPSFFDPTYLMISGAFQLVGVGMFVYGKKMAEPRYVFWGIGCFALSWDYKSAVCWTVALVLAAVGKMFE
ncbi:MAG: hypothetical protein HYY25_14195 [Candidatus Wallbacteria bacterium]|nr:hypothetical protein [Candidatus Wallbacteria bacterium]